MKKLKRKKKQIPGMPALQPDQITELLGASRTKRSKVIWSDEQVLETEDLSHDKKEFVIEGKKIIMETTVVQSTTKHIVLREPGEYEEALDSFINEDGVQWKQH